MSEGEVLVDTEGLARALHHAMAWQYDECDHGKYVGGPNDGQPYAMCEIFARRVVWVLRDEKTKLTLAQEREKFWKTAHGMHQMHMAMRVLVAQCPYCNGRRPSPDAQDWSLDEPVVTVDGKVYEECPRCGNHGPHPAEDEVEQRKSTRAGKFYRLTCASCGLPFVQDPTPGQSEAAALAVIIDSTTAIETVAMAFATATEAISSLPLIKHDPTARECIRLVVPTEDLHDGPCPACRVLRGLIATSELVELIEDEPPLPEETQE